MWWIIPGILISYLIGSIPTAYIFGRVLRGIDIRKFGSGNIGATNALRVLGKKVGITVLILDLLKGFIPVVLLADILYSKTALLSEETLRIILGICCICGHNWTIFLKFKGGKGVATTLGVLLGLSIKIIGLRFILFLMISTWVLVFIISRIVSMASIISALAFPVYTFIFKQSNTLKISSLLLSAFVIIRHKANLKRLIQGKESRIK
jgi:glycerol-3-phosphate acyltransferase PlsY